MFSPTRSSSICSYGSYPHEIRNYSQDQTPPEAHNYRHDTKTSNGYAYYPDQQLIDTHNIYHDQHASTTEHTLESIRQYPLILTRLYYREVPLRFLNPDLC